MVRLGRPREQMPANTCIFHSRVVYDVLRHFGLPARPVPVMVSAHDSAAADFIWGNSAGEPGMTVICGRGNFGHEAGTEWYNGHLVVVSGRHVMDLTLDQFSQPDIDIRLSPVVFESLEISRGRPDLIHLGETTVCYQPIQDSTFYGPSWSRSSLHRDLARKIIRRVDRARRKPLDIALAY